MHFAYEYTHDYIVYAKTNMYIYIYIYVVGLHMNMRICLVGDSISDYVCIFY